MSVKEELALAAGLFLIGAMAILLVLAVEYGWV